MLSTSVRRRVSLVSYLIGLSVGAGLTALTLVVLGSLFRWAVDVQLRWLVVAVACVPLLLREFHSLRFPLPQNARLVPETVFRFGPVFGPLTFGIEMGSGTRTYVTSSIPYMLIVVLFLIADAADALAVALGFAAGRGLMTLAAVAWRDTTQWLLRFRGSDALHFFIAALEVVGLLGLFYGSDAR